MGVAGANRCCRRGCANRQWRPRSPFAQWPYETQAGRLPSYRLQPQGTVHLRSRNNKDFTGRYPGVVTALATLPNDTVIDGEIVALDQDGRPSFNALQNYGSAPAPVVYYVFDVMVLVGRDVVREPLEGPPDAGRTEAIAEGSEPARYASSLDAELPGLTKAERAGVEMGGHGMDTALLTKLLASHA